MNQQEILDYNKRCAKILGYEYIPEKETFAYIPHGWWKKDTFKKPFDKENCLYDHHHLKFHSDWNWIMGVVEAIESIKYKISGESIYTLTISNKICKIESTNDEIVWKKSNSKKEVVVEAINQFLIWYEQNKQL
jgi:hypothetical protein